MAKTLGAMKAIRFHAYGGNEVLKLEDAPRPTPRPAEVLIEVTAAGINPLDWKVRSGALAELMPLPLPFILGWDVAGVVTERGARVEDLEVGDRVFGMIPIGAPGAYAQYALAPANAMAALPPGLTATVAAAMPVVGLAAWQLVHEAGKVATGKRVVVLGAAGQVGRLSAALAHRIGDVRVLAVGRESDLAAVRFPSDVVTVATEAPGIERVASGADLVIDTAGGDLLGRVMSGLNSGARVVSTVQSPDPGVAAARGLSASILQVRPDRSALEQLGLLLGEGALDPPRIDTFPLAEAGRAHAVGEAGTAAKLVLEIS